MMASLRILGVGPLLATLAFASPASAQTIAASAQPYPNRFVNGQNLGVSTRPQDLNPLGVSYADCAENMQLQFSVTVSGFTGQNVAVWVSKTSGCTANQDRGIGTGGAACWFLQQPLTAIAINAPTTEVITLNVQDIIGEQNATAPVVAYVKQGSSACLAQPTFSAVPLNINFIPLDSSGNLVGTAYQYVLDTDLVGPPAPTGVGKSFAGPGLLNVSWAPNTDSDTAGYDVFLDPPGGEDAGASSPSEASVAPDASTVCDDPALEASMIQDGGSGGISSIPTVFLAYGSGTGMTVAGESSESFEVTGLQGGTAYTAVVAAVDGFGNVGPSSSEVCATEPTLEIVGFSPSCAVARREDCAANAWPGVAALGLLWGRRRRTGPLTRARS